MNLYFIQKNHRFVALFIILFLAFVIRVWGVTFGLPYIFHQDEPMAINHAIAYGSMDFNPHYFQLPPLTGYLLFVFYGLFFLIGKLFSLFPTAASFLKLFLLNPTIFYLIARIVLGVVPGTLTVAALYILAKNMTNSKIALLASFLLAISFLHVRNSHYAYHDIPLTLSLVLAFIFCLKFFDTGTIKYIIFSSIMVGLGAGFKYNGIIVILPILYVVYAYRNKVSNSFSPYYFIFIPVVSFLSYAITNPYSIINLSGFIESFIKEKSAHSYVGWLHHVKYSAFEGIGIVITFAAIVGFLFFLMSKSVKKRALSIFVILFYLSIVFLGQIHERYIIPLLPFIVMMAAYFMYNVYTRIKGKFFRYTMIVIFSIASASLIVKCVYSNYLFCRTDSRTEALRWIDSNIPIGSAIALDHTFFSPRLLQSAEQVQDKMNILTNQAGEKKFKKAEILKIIAKENKSYNVYFLNDNTEESFIFSTYPRIDFNFASIRNKKINYIILHKRYPYQEYFNQSFFDAVDKNAELIEVFDPFKANSLKLNFNPSTTAAPFQRNNILSRKSNGPIIYIYKVKK